MSGGRALRITVAGCWGGTAYAIISGGDLLRLKEAVFPECPRDPGIQLAALTLALVDAVKLRAARVEITVPAALAIAAKRSIAGLPPGRGPHVEAWEVYRSVVLALLERFESWEIREGSDRDPTYAALESLCGRAAALICTGPLSELQERTSLGEG